MPGRQAERTKQRAPCTVTIGGRRYNGFLLDFSRTGLFIQTSAKPNPGERLDIDLVIGGKSLPMHVEVVRRKQVPPQLLTVAHGGIGVRILSAPEEFYQLLVAAAAKENGGSAASPRAKREPPPPKPRPRPSSTPPKPTSGTRPKPATGATTKLEEYSVRVKQVNGSRTRTLRVSGADEAEARSEVIEDLGEEWKILEITPV